MQLKVNQTSIQPYGWACFRNATSIIYYEQICGRGRGLIEEYTLTGTYRKQNCCLKYTRPRARRTPSPHRQRVKDRAWNANSITYRSVMNEESVRLCRPTFGAAPVDVQSDPIRSHRAILLLISVFFISTHSSRDNDRAIRVKWNNHQPNNFRKNTRRRWLEIFLKLLILLIVYSSGADKY